MLSVKMRFICGANCFLDASDRLYKPKSKMRELAEEFKKSKAISEEYKATKVSNLKSAYLHQIELGKDFHIYPQFI